MLRLKTVAQCYAWGRLGPDSEVAQLQAAAGEAVDNAKPYAELWMGTHPSGPSTIAGTGIALKDWLQVHSDALGQEVVKRFGCDLPFLFKVLSVNTALSIQSHPDKKLAQRLHAERPHMYKDANHKPEMALALTDFEALCGFVSHGELAAALECTPELRACVGEDAAAALLLCADAGAGSDAESSGSSGEAAEAAAAAAAARAGQTSGVGADGAVAGGDAGDAADSSEASRCKAALKGAFTALMTADSGCVSRAVHALAARLGAQAAAGRPLSAKDALVLRLNSQYPGDVGVLSAYFLNYLSLREGQAIALPANEPHAYVSGEIVECMATSDNVIRAGLTPKDRDTAVLCESLTYHQGPPEVLEGEQADSHTRVYRPPFEEFEMSRVELGAEDAARLPAVPTPRLLLVQRGQGWAEAAGPVRNDALQARAQLARGDVFFVPAGTSFVLRTGGSPMLLWGASANMAFLERPDAGLMN